MLSDEQLRAALKRAFGLGQAYFQQADSESLAENKRADQTRAKFDLLVMETSGLLREGTAGVRATSEPSREAVTVEPENPEEITPVMDNYLMTCCDCGLVHRMRFRAIEVTEHRPDGTFIYEELDPLRYRIQMMVWRHEEQT